MNKEKWAIHEPRLKECKFGDEYYCDSDRVLFIGKTNHWYQHGEAYLLWDKKDNILLALRLETDEELEDNRMLKEAYDELQNKRRLKEALPWYNINRYL